MQQRGKYLFSYGLATIYNAYIKPKRKYNCIVAADASKKTLTLLDRIKNRAFKKKILKFGPYRFWNIEKGHCNLFRPIETVLKIIF